MFSTIGFRGAVPTPQRANANQAAAADLASVITLAIELRAGLVGKGLIKGGAWSGSFPRFVLMEARDRDIKLVTAPLAPRSRG